jgi:Transposase IS116/IS110/IS902 family
VLSAPALTAPPHLAAAKAGSIRLAAEQLLLLHRQRRQWKKRLRELLAGEQAHPDGEIYLSLAGLDIRLAARVLAEVGDGALDFAVPNELQCYGGTAPVTRRSGKQVTIACRLACNRHLRQAAMEWAFCSLTRSAWAREFYASAPPARSITRRCARSRTLARAALAPPPQAGPLRRGRPSAQPLQARGDNVRGVGGWQRVSSCADVLPRRVSRGASVQPQARRSLARTRMSRS